MKYIISDTNDTFFNIAIEEYAFKKLLDEEEIFMLWINRPSIIIGKHQNTIEEINRDYVKDNDIWVARRISGGGAVYHDLNNLNYTIISSKGDEQGVFDFKSFSVPVINTLKELGVDAECSGRNDIEVDSKKICGNAQAYFNGRVMHHGCLLFDVNMGVLGDALKVSADKIKSKGVKSVRARVSNIKPLLSEEIDVKEFRDKLLQYMKKQYPDMTEYVFTQEQLDEIKKAADERLSTWDWVYGKSPDYEIKTGRKFEKGKISAYVDVEKSLIRDIKIYGDFFGIGDVMDIEDKLKGVRFDEESVLKALEDVDLGYYFSGISPQEVAEALTK